MTLVWILWQSSDGSLAHGSGPSESCRNLGAAPPGPREGRPRTAAHETGGLPGGSAARGDGTMRAMSGRWTRALAVAAAMIAIVLGGPDLSTTPYELWHRSHRVSD